MAKRDRNLAALAALGALGYMATRNKSPEEAAAIPVEDRGGMLRRPAAPASAVDRGDDRDIGGGVHPGGFRRNVSDSGEMYDPGTVEDRTPKQRPVVSTPGGRVADSTRSMAPAKQKLLKTDEDFPPVRMPAKSTTSTSPGTMGAYVSRAGTRATEPAASPARSGPEQIPRSGFRTVASDTDPSLRVESDSDAQRNISNVFNALPQGRAAKAAKTIVSAPIRRLAGPAAEAPSAMRSLPAPRPSGPKGDASQTVRGGRTRFNEDEVGMEFKRGGKVKKMASGGPTSSASSRADGIAQRGKTKGRMY